MFEIVGGTDYAFGACFISKVLDGGKGGGLMVGDRLLALGGQGLMYVSGAHACTPFATSATCGALHFLFFFASRCVRVGFSGGGQPQT